MEVEEKWRPVIGWQDYYEVSSLGRVKSLPRTVPDAAHGSKRIKGRILKQTPSGSRNGHLPYPQVSLAKEGSVWVRKVHHLVLEAFVGPRPDGMEARHLNGNHKNASLSNLLYGTKKENQADRITHGTHDRGERHVHAKLTTVDVLKIRGTEWKCGNQEIADLFGVSRALIRRVRNHTAWNWLKP